MNVVPTIDRLLDASSYLEWALDNPEERTELVDGKIVWMSPETNLHSEVKVAVGSAFYAAARRTEPRCRVFSDGSGVKVGEGSVFVP